MTFQSRQMKGSVLSVQEADEIVGAPTISQASHGLSVGDVVRESAAGTYTKAQGDTLANLGVGLGLVVSVPDANTFVLLRRNNAQEVAWTAHGLGTPTFGERLYLSDSTAGAMVTTAPSSIIGPIYLGFVRTANAIQWEPGTL